jgi:release factor glutamine methyltransferase
MRLGEALRRAELVLQEHAVEAPRLNAEVLLMHALGCGRTMLLAHPERALSAGEQTQFLAMVERCAAGEPRQYVTGIQEFWGLEFAVTPAVLIPRPETEHLVEAALALVKQGRLPANLKLIDVGTGSGAIALSLAHELPQAEVTATDISTAALAVARRNAERLGVDGRVRFVESDVLAALPGEGRFDLIVSNPPYVALSEADKVQAIVKDYEPLGAVFAGEDGLSVIERLIPQAAIALRPGGWLMIEIGYSMAEAVTSLLGKWHEAGVIPDLAGIPRVVVARR